MPTSRRTTTQDFPLGSWYAVASAAEVGRHPLAVRVLGRRLAVYRDSKGDPVALDDRCCHSSYPLSLGRVEGDDLRCGYDGFRYGPDGVVREVPSQEHVPVGASVTAYPVRDHAGSVWVWLGSPARAGMRDLPDLPWLDGEGWTTFGDQWTTKASAGLLQDNLADITHLPHLVPEVAPPVLGTTPPPLTVTVSERTVTFGREYPAGPIQPWQAEILGVPVDSTHAQREEGQFLAPGLWVDRWDIDVTGYGDADGTKTLYFTHTITPIDAATTAHAWRVSRNFASSPAATGTLQLLMTEYYRRVQTALEAIQDVLDTDGPRREIHVQADAAKVAVRRIMRRIAAEEGSQG